jgi:hypothetical protein
VIVCRIGPGSLKRKRAKEPEQPRKKTQESETSSKSPPPLSSSLSSSDSSGDVRVTSQMSAGGEAGANGDEKTKGGRVAGNDERAKGDGVKGGGDARKGDEDEGNVDENGPNKGADGANVKGGREEAKGSDSGANGSENGVVGDEGAAKKDADESNMAKAPGLQSAPARLHSPTTPSTIRYTWSGSETESWGDWIYRPPWIDMTDTYTGTWQSGLCYVKCPETGVMYEYDANMVDDRKKKRLVVIRPTGDQTCPYKMWPLNADGFKQVLLLLLQARPSDTDWVPDP